MDINKLQTADLLTLHGSIRRCLAVDDSLPDRRKEFGVREYRDWRAYADAFEAEMETRSVSFEPVDWSVKH